MNNAGKKILIAAIGITILLVLLFGPYGLVYQTSKPSFCNTCHVMRDEYESWFLTGVHRSIACVDCHLPNNNPINHLVWKGIDGTKDALSFFNGIYPDYIRSTGHAKKVIKQNCIRCHNEMVSRIDTTTMDCWACHRKINHKVNEFSYSDIK
jgi:cytochrome c nitrite reductase small subunit